MGRIVKPRVPPAPRSAGPLPSRRRRPTAGPCPIAPTPQACARVFEKGAPRRLTRKRGAARTPPEAVCRVVEEALLSATASKSRTRPGAPSCRPARVHPAPRTPPPPPPPTHLYHEKTLGTCEGECFFSPHPTPREGQSCRSLRTPPPTPTPTPTRPPPPRIGKFPSPPTPPHPPPAHSKTMLFFSSPLPLFFRVPVPIPSLPPFHECAVCVCVCVRVCTCVRVC